MGNMQKVVMAVTTALFPLLIKATDFWFETKKANLSGMRINWLEVWIQMNLMIEWITGGGQKEEKSLE